LPPSPCLQVSKSLHELTNGKSQRHSSQDERRRFIHDLSPPPLRIASRKSSSITCNDCYMYTEGIEGRGYDRRSSVPRVLLSLTLPAELGFINRRGPCRTTVERHAPAFLLLEKPIGEPRPEPRKALARRCPRKSR
jgi:hypothetical protein